MKYVCPDCGFESSDPGNCPSCETPLLKREDEGASLGDTEGLDDDDYEENYETDEDEFADEEW